MKYWRYIWRRYGYVCVKNFATCRCTEWSDLLSWLREILYISWPRRRASVFNRSLLLPQAAFRTGSHMPSLYSRPRLPGRLQSYPRERGTDAITSRDGKELLAHTLLLLQHFWLALCSSFYFHVITSNDLVFFFILWFHSFAFGKTGLVRSRLRVTWPSQDFSNIFILCQLF